MEPLPSIDLKLPLLLLASSDGRLLFIETDSRVYFHRGSLLLLPVARPSDALRKRSRSFSLHFLLPLLFTKGAAAGAEVEAEGEETGVL